MSRTRNILAQPGDRLVIQVRDAEYVKLVFNNQVISFRQGDGVVYSVSEVLYDNPDWEEDPITESMKVDDPRPVVEAAGGTFDQVNAAYASRLEQDSSDSDDDECDSESSSSFGYETDSSPVLEYHYGDTQDLINRIETQVMIEDETQDQDEYEKMPGYTQLM